MDAKQFVSSPVTDRSPRGDANTYQEKTLTHACKRAAARIRLLNADLPAGLLRKKPNLQPVSSAELRVRISRGVQLQKPLFY